MASGGIQFFHVDGYGRVGSVQTVTTKKSTETITRKIRHKSAKEIFDEMMRIEGSCPHVDNPQSPKIVYGVNPLSLIPEMEAWAENAKDARGHKLRKDANCVVCGVASIPRNMEGKFDQFTKDTIKFLMGKYGDRLRSVVAHNDEGHPHIHYVAVPKIGEKFDDIHQGFKASREAKAQGKNKGEQNLAYIKAMRDFQDEFSKNVAMKNGLTRLGPARRRLTRAEWQAEKKQAMVLADALEEAKKVIAQKDVIIKEYRGKGFKAGYTKGLDRANQLSSKVSGFLKLTIKRLHKPTKEIEAKNQELAEKLEQEKKRVEAEKAKANDIKKDGLNRAIELNQELDKKNSLTKSLSKELDKKDVEINKLAEIIQWYEKKFGTTKGIKNN